MLDDLRRELTERGLTERDVLLPGDTREPLQGALALRATDSGYDLVTIDYGREAPLRRWNSVDEAVAGVLEYVDRPLPAPERPNASAFAALGEANAAHYADLRSRLAAGGSLLIELPALLPLDRIGALDGVILFPADTTVEERALPRTALADGAALHRFVTSGDVLVRAELVQPWFGQPGGGLRFTLGEDFVGIRDLLVADRLRQVELQPVPA